MRRIAAVPDGAARRLSRLGNLRELQRGGHHDARRFTDAGLAHLGQLTRLTRLRRLDLSFTGRSPAAVPLLWTFTRFEALNLHGTRVGERGLATPRKALPGAEIS